jgi:ureidoacrylate peracid hydrolase
MTNLEKDHNIIAIDADPESLEIVLAKSVLVVVDMQNAFVKDDGYFGLAGYDLTMTRRILEPCRKLVTEARHAGIKIIYFQMGCSKDLSDIGPPDSPVHLKSKALKLIADRPDWADKFYFYGTWGAEIIDELKPQVGDILIRKQRYDGYIGTNLDLILRTLNAKYLIFIGTATNICVESTIRHAFFLDYYPIVISDAVSPLGDESIQQATLENIRLKFGWVTTSASLLSGLKTAKA